MVIVIRRCGVAHAGEWFSAGAEQGIEMWPSSVRCRMPPQPFSTIDLEGDLRIGNRNGLYTGDFAS